MVPWNKLLKKVIKNVLERIHDGRIRKIIFIMAVVSYLTTLTGIYVLYRFSLEQQGKFLQVVTESQAKLVQSLIRYHRIDLLDQQFSSNYLMQQHILRRIAYAYNNYKGFGETGELLIAHRVNDEIRFIVSHRYGSMEKQPPIPMNSLLAEPMRRALNGLDGVIVDKDYNNSDVLAAFSPVPEMNLGIVAKMHISEIREPFLIAGLISMVFGSVIVLIGTGVMVMVIQLFVLEIEEKNHSLKAALRTQVGLRKELETSNKDLAQFAYVASHDLQAPLRSIVNFSQIIQQRYSEQLDEEGTDFINRIIKAGQRMRELILNLLEFSRVGTHGRSFEYLDCTEILDRWFEDHNIENDKYGDLQKVVQFGELPEIYGDRMQIYQLFDNIISNGLKYNKNPEPGIVLEGEMNEDSVVIRIRDNGIGIDPRFLDDIFVIFHRLHVNDEYGGTGIGLAICKRIMERHHGSIRAESEPGKGTTMILTFPTEEVHQENPEAAKGNRTLPGEERDRDSHL